MAAKTPPRRILFEPPFAPPGAKGSRTVGTSHEHPIEGPAAGLFGALQESMAAVIALIARSGIGALPESVSPAVAVERLPAGLPVADAARTAAAAILDVVLRGAALSDATVEEGERSLRAATRTLIEDAERALAGPVPTRVGRGSSADATAALLREVALESFDADVGVRARGAAHLLVSEAIDPATAHVRLLDTLLSRLEASLLGNELLLVEREASSWWFRRWSVRGGPDSEHGRRIREMEWSFIDRPTLFMGPVLERFLALGGQARLPERQSRLARALLSSFSGVFAVRDRRPDVALLQDVESGRQFLAHEHAQTLPYERGWVAVGRLYVFDGSVHLRSPGMAFLPSKDEQASRQLAQAVRRGQMHMPLPLSIEALLTALARPGPVPQTLPASSPAGARAWLERASRALDAAGLMEGSEESPGDASDAAYRKRNFRVDDVVADWLNALVEQIQRSGPRGAGDAAGHAHRGAP
jgi:hypothetical protein